MNILILVNLFGPFLFGTTSQVIKTDIDLGFGNAEGNPHFCNRHQRDPHITPDDMQGLSFSSFITRLPLDMSPCKRPDFMYSDVYPPKQPSRAASIVERDVAL
jgi:hypothetical protein